MLELQFKKEAAFPKALEEHWKATFNLYNPEVLEVDNEDVFYGICGDADSLRILSLPERFGNQ